MILNFCLKNSTCSFLLTIAYKVVSMYAFSSFPILKMKVTKLGKKTTEKRFYDNTFLSWLMRRRSIILNYLIFLNQIMWYYITAELMFSLIADFLKSFGSFVTTICCLALLYSCLIMCGSNKKFFSKNAKSRL